MFLFIMKTTISLILLLFSLAFSADSLDCFGEYAPVIKKAEKIYADNQTDYSINSFVHYRYELFPITMYPFSFLKEQFPYLSRYYKISCNLISIYVMTDTSEHIVLAIYEETKLGDIIKTKSYTLHFLSKAKVTEKISVERKPVRAFFTFDDTLNQFIYQPDYH